MTPRELSTALHQALMAGRHGEDIRHLFTEDAVTIEHPNALLPRGGRKRLEEMLAGSTSGASLLTRQEYEVHQAVETDDEVVLRLTWTGHVRNAVGPFAAGQELRAHIVQFIRVHEGRIREIETYDCYEPFA
jgi:ketosteroid isomerase-like protein